MKTHACELEDRQKARQKAEQECNSHPPWLDVAELVFNARMKVGSPSVEYMKHIRT